MKFRCSSSNKAVLAAFCLLSFVSVPRVHAQTSLPACTLADVDQALGDSPSCSSDGAVFFGSDVTEFVLSQCKAVSIPNEGQDAINQAKAACIRCARSAWEAYGAAAKAKLIPGGARPSKASVAKIKALCKITDNGGDSQGDGHDAPQDGALGAMYSQLKLCFPHDGQAVSPESCSSCAVQVLDSALSSGVLGQQKYTVLKQSVQQACSHQGEAHPTPTPGSGDGTPRPSPTPSPLAALYSSVRACVDSTLKQNPPARDACVSCINGISTAGIEPSVSTPIIQYATSVCQGSFVPHN